MIGALSAIFWGLLILSILVFVHEGGHYLAARAFGIRVTEFFLGMPSRIRLSHKSVKYGTELGVTPLLLGGYTKICGMEGNPDNLLAPALACVQAHGRVVVADLAQELSCDETRAYQLMATLSDWAAIRPYYNPELGEKPSQKDWPHAFETLKRDGEFRCEYDRGHNFLDGKTTDYGQARPLTMDAEDFLGQERNHTYLGCGFWKRFIMLCAGPLVNVVLAFVLVVGCLTINGTQVTVNSNELGGVQAGSYAEQAGLVAGDIITKVNNTEVHDWTEFHDALQAPLAQGGPLSVTYLHNNQEHAATVTLPTNAPTQYFGVTPPTKMYRMSFPEASVAAVNYAGMVAAFAVKLIMPQHTMEVLDSSTSIVGISVMASQAASLGIADLLFFVAAISMSLGFMNLLPIPPLDGGKILIEAIQSVARRTFSLKTQSIVSYIGLAFFLFVFFVVLKNDLFRFVIG